MNNYCINLKKRKNKPFCKIKNKDITFSQCKDCNNKEYKTNSADFCRKMQCSADIKRKKSTFRSKSPLFDEKIQKYQQKLTKNSKYERFREEKSLKTAKNVKKVAKLSRNAQLQEKDIYKKVKMHKKSKKLTKLERNRKSVFTEDLVHCYLCNKKKNDLHEVFGGRNRINSIKYKFILPLCRECHSLNQNNPFFNDCWHRQGQLYWEEHIGSREEFVKVFRRNYLE